MSYILEALKKAEAERERSNIPGLTTAQGNSTIYITRQSNSKAWWITGALAVSLAAVVSAWVLRSPGTDASLPPVAQLPGAPVPAPVSVPVQAAVPVAKETPRSTVAKVVATTPPAAKPEPLKAPAVTAPVAQPVAPVMPAPARAAPAAVATPAPAPAPVAATPAPAVRPAGNAVPQFSELPEAMRRQIPALHISGAVYSDSPPEWTLIINDQIMSRGSQVAPDVRLEEVTAGSAVFNFKGQRFRMDR